jgi:tryptophan-rich sensory protein
MFFGAKKLGLALANITALDVGVAATAHSFWGVDPLASKLMWPYMAWVSYATALNAYIWWHNPPPKQTDTAPKDKRR